MKSPATIALALAAPLIVVIGFRLPDIVCRLQDDARDASVSRYDARPVQLDFEPVDGALPALQAFASNAVFYNLENDRRTFPYDIRAVVGEVLPPAPSLQTIDITSCDVEIVPMLAIGADDSQAALLWSCAFAFADNADTSISAFVDDATGKIVQLTCFIKEDDAPDENAVRELLGSWMDAWASHLDLDVVESDGSGEIASGATVSSSPAEHDGGGTFAIAESSADRSLLAYIPDTEFGLRAERQSIDGFHVAYSLEPVKLV